MKNYELPLIRVRLGELSSGEIAALLNREVLDFPTGRPFYAWSRRIEKDCCLIDRLYFDDHYYEDEPHRMIGVLEKEAEKRGIKKVPLDELKTVAFPYGDLSVSILPTSYGDRYAELRGYMIATCGTLLKGFPEFYVVEGKEILFGGYENEKEC